MLDRGGSHPLSRSSVEAYYAVLWEKDRLAKEQRAEHDRLVRVTQTRAQHEALEEQVRANEQARYNEQLLKEEEQQLRVCGATWDYEVLSPDGRMNCVLARDF